MLEYGLNHMGISQSKKHSPLLKYLLLGDIKKL